MCEGTTCTYTVQVNKVQVPLDYILINPLIAPLLQRHNNKQKKFIHVPLLIPLAIPITLLTEINQILIFFLFGMHK